MIFPRIIIFFGLPGSGKGTQAELIAEKFGFFHFDTGKVIEAAVHDPARQDDLVIKHEQMLFETGKWNTPSWVEDLVKTKTKEYLEAGTTLVFSGSPRTLPEAQGLWGVWEPLVGKDGLLIFSMDIKEETSVYRNSNRRVCEKCRTPVIWSKDTENWVLCPRCGAKLVKRVLDKPEIIKKRIEEHINRTAPAIDFFEKKGIKIIHIDAERQPEEISKEILKYLGK